MSLLEVFEQQEQKFSKIGARDLHKLKYVYDSTSSNNYTKLEFELKMLFKFVEALEPKDMRIALDDAYRRIEKLEFNPTISGPNIVIRDRLDRAFSIWYKPLFYVPTASSAKQLLLDFVILRGSHDSMYNLNDDVKRQLYSYEFLSDTLLREICIKLLSQLKTTHIAMQCKKEFKPSDITEIKEVSYFLKPSKFLLVSEEYIPDAVKMSAPVNVVCAENLDMNSQKFSDLAKRVV